MVHCVVMQVDEFKPVIAHDVGLFSDVGGNGAAFNPVSPNHLRMQRWAACLACLGDVADRWPRNPCSFQTNECIDFFFLLLGLRGAISSHSGLALLLGKMSELEPCLKDAEDGIARDHSDDTAFMENGHLIDIVRLHPL